MSETQLNVGSASVDITPTESVPLMGYGPMERVSTGVHDPLTAAALVLSDGRTTVGVVAADVLLISKAMRENVEEGLAAAGVPIDELLLTATHTHSGPYIPSEIDEQRGGLENRYQSISDLGYEGAVRRTVGEITSGMVEALTAAHERREPATMRVGRSETQQVAFNRRSHGGICQNVTVAGGDDPLKDTDPELTVLHVESESGQESVLLNFACHPVCITRHESLVSADYPGVIYERLADVMDDPTVLFVNGAAGDIAPRGFHDWERRMGRDYEYTDAVGGLIADTALDAVADAKASAPLDEPAVTGEHQEVSLLVRDTDGEALQREQAEVEALVDRLTPPGDYLTLPSHQAELSRQQRYLLEVNELLSLHEWSDARGGDPLVDHRVTHLQLGPVDVVSIPGEPLVDHGLDLKAGATGPLVVAGYANGFIGYLPTREEFDKGGYEVHTCRLAPEAIDDLRETAFEFLS